MLGRLAQSTVELRIPTGPASAPRPSSCPATRTRCCRRSSATSRRSFPRNCAGPGSTRTPRTAAGHASADHRTPTPPDWCRDPPGCQRARSRPEFPTPAVARCGSSAAAPDGSVPRRVPSVGAVDQLPQLLPVAQPLLGCRCCPSRVAGKQRCHQFVELLPLHPGTVPHQSPALQILARTAAPSCAHGARRRQCARATVRHASAGRSPTGLGASSVASSSGVLPPKTPSDVRSGWGISMTPNTPYLGNPCDPRHSWQPAASPRMAHRVAEQVETAHHHRQRHPRPVLSSIVQPHHGAAARVNHLVTSRRFRSTMVRRCGDGMRSRSISHTTTAFLMLKPRF